MNKPIRMMKIDLACKRKGAATHGFRIEWKEPEEKALETFEHFHECLRAMLKAHGLMTDQNSPND